MPSIKGHHYDTDSCLILRWYCSRCWILGMIYILNEISDSLWVCWCMWYSRSEAVRMSHTPAKECCIWLKPIWGSENNDVSVLYCWFKPMSDTAGWPWLVWEIKHTSSYCSLTAQGPVHWRNDLPLWFRSSRDYSISWQCWNEVFLGQKKYMAS